MTLPAAIREHLGVAERDKIAFVIGEDGIVQVRPVAYPTIASLAGAAGSLPRPMPWKEMLEIAREDHLAAKFGRHE